MSKKYLSMKNMPPRLPIMGAAFWFMFIQYYHLPQWTLGVWGAVFAISFVAELIRMAKYEEVEL